MSETSLLNRITNYIVERLDSNKIFAEYYKRTAKRAPWTRQAVSLRTKDIDSWKQAVMHATDPEQPKRGELMRFYENLMLDNHLASVIDTRILKVQRSGFKLINQAGKENDALKTLLERPWFEDLVRLVLISRFQGTTLIEIFDLNEKMEIKEVTEIPQSNFVASQDIVIKEEYDDKGINYQTPPMNTFYLQIGNDWDLGMLNQLAMIVLAKKLGLGSWMSYVDKFGVPPIFAITERMDTARRDELFEMLSDFRQNHFAVLQGNEKIEVPKADNVDPGIKSLIEDVCNKEISKRILGGTALTDEKSFVGSSEVQERVAADRYEADRLLFKYIFNEHIAPRLVKLSPVYADFATHTLEWDDKESLSINDYIAAVVSLSPHFDFDTKELVARTGLPILAKKEVSNPFANTVVETKKKSVLVM